MGMATEESLHNADLVCQKTTKGQAHQPGGHAEPITETPEAASEETECGRDAHGDDHHACDGSHPKDQKVNNRPSGVSNAGQD